MSEKEVRALIRRNAEQAGSMRALAKQWNISQSHLDKEVRGDQAIGAKTLSCLGLVRRKTYQFHPLSRKGIDELVREVVERIRDHDMWREDRGIIQRRAGGGKFMPAHKLARIIGVSPDDVLAIAGMDIGFPAPDAGPASWKPSTIYDWLRQKARKLKS